MEWSGVKAIQILDLRCIDQLKSQVKPLSFPFNADIYCRISALKTIQYFFEC